MLDSRDWRGTPSTAIREGMTHACLGDADISFDDNWILNNSSTYFLPVATLLGLPWDRCCPQEKVVIASLRRAWELSDAG